MLMLHLFDEFLRSGLLSMTLAAGVSLVNRGLRNCQTSMGVVRTFANPYMLSWRTNDEKRACLKYRGKMEVSSPCTFLTMKEVP